MGIRMDSRHNRDCRLSKRVISTRLHRPDPNPNIQQRQESLPPSSLVLLPSSSSSAFLLRYQAVTPTLTVSRYLSLLPNLSVPSACREYGVHLGSSWKSRMAVMVFAESTVKRW